MNAKFNPGALVDLEYAVQLLQILHAHTNVKLRTPLLHDALREMKETNVLEENEAERLIGAYDFFRMLINGLRMLRGTAQDLFLPKEHTAELFHLARRIGYKAKGEISSEQQLIGDFKTQTAFIRSFINKYFGREFIPSPYRKNMADIILSGATDDAATRNLLSAIGFHDPGRALTNLLRLAGNHKQKELFSRLVVIAGDILAQLPDPDMALNNWEHFSCGHVMIEDHFKLLLDQPERLVLLLNIFSVSHFLSETLIRHPVFFEELIKNEAIEKKRTQDFLQQELVKLNDETFSHEDWLNALRLVRRREILRIGIRDIHLHMPLPIITQELSTLAEEILKAALSRIIREGALPNSFADSIAILALGKLGGGELNYSSDIDLLCLYENEDGYALNEAVIQKLIHDLTHYTEEGYIYRVDMRLRPHGKAGLLVIHFNEAVSYYQTEAKLWELQALIKLKPIAGNLRLGTAFMEKMKSLLLKRRSKEEVSTSIASIRKKTIHQLSQKRLKGFDIKNSSGGIRDIEFLVQGLILINARQFPGLLIGNTLSAIEALHDVGILRKEKAQQMIFDYLFLRKIEHFLQIYEDVQTHSLPDDIHDRETLAKRVLGKNASINDFEQQLSKCTQRVYADYLSFIEGV
jgi:glutamate-ammonia-ligase adenylyltransferase